MTMVSCLLDHCQLLSIWWSGLVIWWFRGPIYPPQKPGPEIPRIWDCDYGRRGLMLSSQWATWKPESFHGKRTTLRRGLARRQPRVVDVATVL